MKKNNNTFATFTSIISLVYKVTFILGTIVGIVLWVFWWMDYKKLFNQKNMGEEINKISDPEKEIPNEPVMNSWIREWNEEIKPELDKTCKSAYEVEYDEDDRELY